jgi:hypothetical protein
MGTDVEVLARDSAFHQDSKTLRRRTPLAQSVKEQRMLGQLLVQLTRSKVVPSDVSSEDFDASEDFPHPSQRKNLRETPNVGTTKPLALLGVEGEPDCRTLSFQESIRVGQLLRVH